MQAKLLKLSPNSRFHFGKSNVISKLKSDTNDQVYTDGSASLTDTDTFLRSDVLFSALVTNLSQIKPQNEVDSFVQAFEEGHIKISSGFYCLEKNRKNSQKEKAPEYIYLLPKPVTAPNYIDIEKYDRIKQIKKVQFVCLDTIHEKPDDWLLLGNVGISSGRRQTIDPNQKFFYEGDEPEEGDNDKENFKLFSKEVATHVGIHRPNDNAYGPFSVSYIQIPDYQEYDLAVHFYFLYEVIDQYRELFNLAVELLRYNGVGGERSSGYGQIGEVQDTEVNLNLGSDETNADSHPQITLSMVIPEQDEVENLLFYQFSKRGGRETPHGRLESVHMIHEGAILKKEIKGMVASIAPEASKAKYKRNGKCFSIPVNPIFTKREDKNESVHT